AVLEALVPGDDDGRAIHEAARDLDHAGTAVAELDPGLDRLAVLDAEDEGLARARDDSALGHEHDLALRAALDENTREQAGAQHAFGIVEARADLQRAAVHVDQRVDGVDARLER